jgi:glucose/arabinose dehydrogenase
MSSGTTTRHSRARRRPTARTLLLGVAGGLAVAASLTGVLSALHTGSSAGARTATSGLVLREQARGFEAPTGLEFRPGAPDRLYVLEQEGRIRVAERGRLLASPLLDIRRSVSGGGERGLLGLAFAPDHALTGLLYVHYTDRRGDTRVVRYRARGDRVDPASARTLLRVRQPYENHKGGQLAFGPDGRLYLGLGDGGSAFDPDRRGQRLSSPLAKVLRLDVRRPDRGWKPVAYGLRNPWRFSFDRLTGDMWIADVGQDSMEEVNVLPRGQRGLANFGWGVYEGRVPQRRGHRLNPRGRLAWPVVSYGRREGCSVTGGYVYRGAAMPALRGRYVYGDLCTGTIWSLARGPRGTEVRRERARLPLLTSFAQDARGELHAVSLDGRAYALGWRGEGS